MNAAVFVPSNGQPQSQAGAFPSYGMASIGESAPYSPTAISYGKDGERFGNGTTSSLPAILLRKLPGKMTDRELRSMFMMAKDCVESEFVRNEHPEDKGFATALCRFRSVSAAQDVRASLNGKPNSADEANMIIEVLSPSAANTYVSRRAAPDGVRGPPSSGSSTASSTGPTQRNPSRYNGAFQSMDKLSPPSQKTGLDYANGGANGDFPNPETNSHFQNLFSPQSPISNQLNEYSQLTGKAIINSDSLDDDETGELLKDPVAYAKNGHSTPGNNLPRRQTNPQMPISRFNSLSLSSNTPPSTAASYASSNRGGPVQTPVSAMSPMQMGSMGPNSNYQLSSQYLPRPNYPPANPADQNPPCNTLYVGNLPIDTSEDELKNMFSKQRGYKRLCFRTKQQGPMCFVEFEDVSFATKALNDLYGYPLHNSVKGGIRLSFSKNPLGVRSGQQNTGVGMPPTSSSHGGMSGVNGGMGGAVGQGFPSANGPPPGLSAPPGLNSSLSMSSVPSPAMMAPMNGMVMNGVFNNGGFGMGALGMEGYRQAMPAGMPSNGGMPPMNGGNGQYSDYMMGR
jgi:hypothetical protein